MSKTNSSDADKRKHKRRPILETFSVFVVFDKKGPHRLNVHDVSETGIGFTVDVEGETASDFPLKKGDEMELSFYLNQTLSIPLIVKVARLEEKDSLRHIGGEIAASGGKGLPAFRSFLQMLDQLAEVAQISSPK